LFKEHGQPAPLALGVDGLDAGQQKDQLPAVSEAQ
jgi:hypothetical protein